MRTSSHLHSARRAAHLPLLQGCQDLLAEEYNADLSLSISGQRGDNIDFSKSKGLTLLAQTITNNGIYDFIVRQSWLFLGSKGENVV